MFSSSTRGKIYLATAAVLAAGAIAFYERSSPQEIQPAQPTSKAVVFEEAIGYGLGELAGIEEARPTPASEDITIESGKQQSLEEQIESFWTNIEYIPESEVKRDHPSYHDPTKSGNLLFRVEDPNVYVARNFQLKEFVRTGGEILPYARLDRELVDTLQQLRDEVGPINITSAYRPPWRQKQVNPSSTLSRHQSGDAADIYIPGFSKEGAIEAIKRVFGTETGGLGAYKTHGAIHVDLRKKRTTWGLNTSEKESHSLEQCRAQV